MRIHFSVFVDFECGSCVRNYLPSPATVSKPLIDPPRFPEPGAQQQPPAAPPDWPGVLHAGLLRRHQLPGPVAVPTLRHGLRVLRAGGPEEQPRGEGTTSPPVPSCVDVTPVTSSGDVTTRDVVW